MNPCTDCIHKVKLTSDYYAGSACYHPDLVGPTDPVTGCEDRPDCDVQRRKTPDCDKFERIPGGIRGFIHRWSH